MQDSEESEGWCGKFWVKDRAAEASKDQLIYTPPSYPLSTPAREKWPRQSQQEDEQDSALQRETGVGPQYPQARRTRVSRCGVRSNHGRITDNISALLSGTQSHPPQPVVGPAPSEQDALLRKTLRKTLSHPVATFPARARSSVLSATRAQARTRARSRASRAQALPSIDRARHRLRRSTHPLTYQS